MLKFNPFKAKEQFWNDVFRTINIYQTGEKYYLTHGQDLAFFCIFELILIPIDSVPLWVMFFPSFINVFEEVLKC